MSNAPEPGPARWERLGERTLASTRVLDLQLIHYRHPRRGTDREFVSVHAPDWVNVVALTAERHLVLVRQFRYGINDFSLEVPGGVIEAQEDPVVAGVRELAEETGFTGGRACLLGAVHPNPAIQDNRCHAVLVEGATRSGSLAWDTDEEIEMLTAPVNEVLQWARSGKITHSLSLTALMLFEPRWREQSAPSS